MSYQGTIGSYNRSALSIVNANGHVIPRNNRELQPKARREILCFGHVIPRNNRELQPNDFADGADGGHVIPRNNRELQLNFSPWSVNLMSCHTKEQ